MRFSPGYCDWPVEEQRILDGILDFSKIGVRLTDSYMMAPKKSVSGVVGIGPKNIFSGSRSQCEICGDKECGYKR
jgi:cobalamin-dependent methionine synthase I